MVLPEQGANGMKFAVGTSALDRHVTVGVAGESDLQASTRLGDVLYGAIATRPTAITVDLAGLTFIDSTSIGILVGARRSALEHGIGFTVTSPRGNVLRVLEMIGV